MPFVVGILASELNEVLTLPMDEVLIVNIDTDSFIRTPGTNDLNILPQNYTEPLKKVVKASTKVVQSKFLRHPKYFSTSHVITTKHDYSWGHIA